MKTKLIRLLTSIFAAFALVFTIGCEPTDDTGGGFEEPAEAPEDPAAPEEPVDDAN